MTDVPIPTGFAPTGSPTTARPVSTTVSYSAPNSSGPVAPVAAIPASAVPTTTPAEPPLTSAGVPVRRRWNVEPSATGSTEFKPFGGSQPLTETEPQGSKMGMYITIAVITILGLIVIFQVISKSSLSNKVRTLETQAKQLADQNLALLLENKQCQVSSTTTSSTTTGGTTVTTAEYYPVMYHDGNSQKTAQTFQLDQLVSIAGVYLKSNGGLGKKGQVSLYQGDSPANVGGFNRAIVQQKFDPSQMPVGGTFTVPFQKPVDIKANTSYVVMVEVTDKDSRAHVGYAGDVNPAGTMWAFARKLNEAGEVIDDKFTWQQLPQNDLTIDLKAATSN